MAYKVIPELPESRRIPIEQAIARGRSVSWMREMLDVTDVEIAVVREYLDEVTWPTVDRRMKHGIGEAS